MRQLAPTCAGLRQFTPVRASLRQLAPVCGSPRPSLRQPVPARVPVRPSLPQPPLASKAQRVTRHIILRSFTQTHVTHAAPRSSTQFHAGPHSSTSARISSYQRGSAGISGDQRGSAGTSGHERAQAYLYLLAARINPWAARSIIFSSTQKVMRKCPGQPNPVPGTARISSSTRLFTKA